jgi:arylsulfatase A-like enzyme
MFLGDWMFVNRNILNAFLRPACRFFLFALLSLCPVVVVCAGESGETEVDSSMVGQAAAGRPNVLFIVVDDLSAFVTRDDSPLRAHTPNIDRLREMGVSFTDAHCNAPICGPSRSSFLYGYLPSTTGFFGYRQNRRASAREYPVFESSRNLMELFREQGYTVAGTGKIGHGFYPEDWDEGRFCTGTHSDYGPWPADGAEALPRAHPNLPAPLSEKPWLGFGRLSDVPVFDGHEGGWIYYGKDGSQVYTEPFRYRSHQDRDLLPDEKSAKWAADFLAEKQDRPFFLALGFVQPHAPHYLPDNYIDAYDLDQITVPDPEYPATVPDIARSPLTPDDWGPDAYKNLTQTTAGSQLPGRIRAYLASSSFMDAQLGVVLDALESSSYVDNTIVVFFSDHGYHLGSKGRVFKNSLWQETTQVPLVIVPLGARRAGTSQAPVSLVDLYPTLLDLCGLPAQRHQGERPLDGHSLLPALLNPQDWGNQSPVAVFVAGTEDLEYLEPGVLEKQHTALIDSQWRYIRYGDGSEELWSRNSHGLELPLAIGLGSKADEVLTPFRGYFERALPQPLD